MAAVKTVSVPSSQSPARWPGYHRVATDRGDQPQQHGHPDDDRHPDDAPGRRGRDRAAHERDHDAGQEAQDEPAGDERAGVRWRRARRRCGRPDDEGAVQGLLDPGHLPRQRLVQPDPVGRARRTGVSTEVVRSTTSAALLRPSATLRRADSASGERARVERSARQRVRPVRDGVGHHARERRPAASRRAARGACGAATTPSPRGREHQGQQGRDRDGDDVAGAAHDRRA